jgi:glycosyltransferase involved in cell wall biosynthesis
MTPQQRPVRIAYVFARALPARDTDTQQVVKTIDSLARAGAAVDLFVPPAASGSDPVTLERDVRTFYSARGPFRLCVIPGLRAGELRLPGALRALLVQALPGVGSGPIEIARPIHGVVASAVAWQRGYDVVYTRSRAAVLTCIALGQPVVFETYRRLGHETPGFVRTLGVAARRGRLLGVITHSNTALRSFVDASFPAARAAAIVNGHDPADWQCRPSKVEARARLGFARDRPLVAYTGHVGPRKGMPMLLDVAQRVPEVDFVVVGGNPEEVEVLERDARTRGLANLRCVGFRPAHELPSFLLAADVLFIPPTAAPLEQHGRTVLPMKVFSYLAAGRPILAGRLPDVAEVLIDGENARLVTPDAPDDAARALRTLLADSELCKRLSAAARRSAAELTWENRAHRLLTQLERWRGMRGRDLTC